MPFHGHHAHGIYGGHHGLVGHHGLAGHHGLIGHHGLAGHHGLVGPYAGPLADVAPASFHGLVGHPNGAVTPIELASAYSSFANNGYLAPTYLIEKITDANGQVLYQHITSQRITIPDPGAAAAEADPDLRQQYFDMHYEKINQTYYINENTFDNAMQQESFYSNLQTVTESVASKDTIQTTSNNAELILRELFVPIQEEVAEVKVAVATKSFAKPRHWSVKDFPRRSRRSTSDLQQQASKRRLHSSLKQRSSLQSMRTLSSSSVSASVSRSWANLCRTHGLCR